jgi:hypothetical protein
MAPMLGHNTAELVGVRFREFSGWNEPIIGHDIRDHLDTLFWLPLTAPVIVGNVGVGACPEPHIVSWGEPMTVNPI